MDANTYWCNPCNTYHDTGYHARNPEWAGRQAGKTHWTRIEKLKSGDYQFGHAGQHHGNGSPDCPRELHHHHDEFCDLPIERELIEAGIDPKEFKPGSRA